MNCTFVPTGTGALTVQVRPPPLAGVQLPEVDEMSIPVVLPPFGVNVSQFAPLDTYSGRRFPAVPGRAGGGIVIVNVAEAVWRGGGVLCGAPVGVVLPEPPPPQPASSAAIPARAIVRFIVAVAPSGS